MRAILGALQTFLLCAAARYCRSDITGYVCWRTAAVIAEGHPVSSFKLKESKDINHG
jgi:hypothetical protein